MSRLPSIKTLEAAFPGKGKALRKLLESDTAVDENPAVVDLVFKCWNKPWNSHKRMVALDDVLETHGVEHVSAGTNQRSPAFDYCNAGDTYATTIIRVNGVYRVGCIGDIIEKGNYR